MLLHTALQHAVALQLLATNPAHAVKAPKVQHVEMHTLDEEGALTVLKAAMDTPYYALFHTALATGMRRGELLALRWQDIDLLGAEVSVSRSMHRLNTHVTVFGRTKTASSARMISLDPATCDVLRHHVDNEMALCGRVEIPFANDRLVFCRWDGEPLVPGTISQAWRRLTRHLGFKNIRFHDLRHTHATMLMKNGTPPLVVMQRLGHANISITLGTYSHVTPGMQKQAAETFGKLFGNGISKGLADGDYVNLPNT
jgi:integrase